MSSFMRPDYQKLKIALRYWIQGRAETDPKWALALEALEFAATYHTGERKNGSPELLHQIEIAHYLRTLERHLLHPVETLCCALLHDVCEDYDVGFDEINRRFGDKVAGPVELLTKAHRGAKKNIESYYDELAKDACASIVKGADRLNNHSSMPGAFTFQKQLAYMEETQAWVLLMLKKARRQHPLQEAAYENCKIALTSQIAMLRPALERLIVLETSKPGPLAP